MKLFCLRKLDTPTNSRCANCVDKHVVCSLRSGLPEDSIQESLPADDDETPSVPPDSPKSKKLFSAIKDKFRRKSSGKGSVDLEDPPETPALPSASSPSVIPYFGSRVTLPPPSSLVSDFDATPSLPPPSLYSSSLHPSSSSLTPSSELFTHMDPSDPSYSYELQRLQIRYQASQESLRIAQRQAELEADLNARQLADAEARYRRELEDLRREMGGSSSARKGKGKGKK